MGKRDLACNAEAVAVAERLAEADDPASRRVGREACKELTSRAVQERLAAWRSG